MKKLYIANGLIVNEGKSVTGSILTEGNFIREIFTGSERPVHIPDAETIDATGMLVMPGVIDDQVHFREPGLTHKGDFATESAAAVAGGITSVMEMPNTVPQTITMDLLKKKHEMASRSSRTNYSFYLGATNNNIEEIRNADPALVCGIKVFMGASTGNMLVDNQESLRKIFAGTSLPVACHCEDEPTIRANMQAYTEEYGDDMPFEYHPLIRSREACLKSSSLAVSLAVEYGTRLHILHLSTAEEMSLFGNATPLSEKKITAEVCVHHLWFSDSSYKEKGAFIKWNPAIKKDSDRQALIEAVNSDMIDIIATDHAPHTLDEKRAPYTKAPSGGPLVQHSLVAMMEMWYKGLFTLEKIVEKMCHNPAILFQVEKRGYIRKGYYADIVIVDPASKWRVSEKNILYKCGWSPFEGYLFSSTVQTTVVNGKIAWNNGELADNINSMPLTFNRK
ncbi:MAG: dihydroorotase [Bacteroidales bacterium]|nr:dihydroorotase [Bacteroidales bacterium]